jgi:hypothetical protein
MGALRGREVCLDHPPRVPIFVPILKRFDKPQAGCSVPAA